MKGGEFVFLSSFDPVSGETEYEKVLLLEFNEDSGKAKVAKESPNGYGDINNFIPADKLAEESPEE